MNPQAKKHLSVYKNSDNFPQVDVLDGQGYVILLDSMGHDKRIASRARVKSEDTELYDKDAKLVRYMSDNQHTSPFEHVVFQFEVKAPIFVLRQWHRHRTWSYNEISARYSVLPEDFYVPALEMVGQQSKTNKQVRDLMLDMPTEYREKRTLELEQYRVACEQANALYKSLLASGWPRELARMVLPVSMFSKMVAQVNLHNLIHFLKLRLHEHAQIEIREYAKALAILAARVVPYTMGLVLYDLSQNPAYKMDSHESWTDHAIAKIFNKNPIQEPRAK